MLLIDELQKSTLILESFSHQIDEDIAIDASIHRFKLTMRLCFLLLRKVLKKKHPIRKLQNIISKAVEETIIPIQKQNLWLTMLTDFKKAYRIDNYQDINAISTQIPTYIPEIRKTVETIKETLLPEIQT